MLDYQICDFTDRQEHAEAEAHWAATETSRVTVQGRQTSRCQ